MFYTLLVSMCLWLIWPAFASSNYALNSTISIALVTSQFNKLNNSLSESFLKQNDNSALGIFFGVHRFDHFEHFINKTFSDCDFAVVVAAVSCADNVKLYDHLRDSCPNAVLYTLFEFICQRPPNDMGIGIPHFSALDNITALLTDIGLSLNHRWPQITVMSDTELDTNRFDQLVNTIKSFSANSQVEEFRLVEESMLTQSLSPVNLQVLKSFKGDTQKHLFVIITNRLVLEKVILASKQLSLINFINKWVFILTERFPIELLSNPIKDIVSESDIVIIQSNRNQEDCLALDVDCTIEMLENMLGQVVRKLITESGFNFKTSPGKTKNRFLSESRILLANSTNGLALCGNCDHYRMESLAKHRTNDIVDSNKDIVQVNQEQIQFEVITQTDGVWSPFKGLLIKNDQDSETNLKNRPLNIGIVDQPPMIRIYKNGVQGNSSQVEIVGTTYQMVLVLAAKLNFTPNFVVDYSLDMGYLQSDGHWTGMLKRVIEGEVDIGANAYWKTYDRLKAVYFTFPFNLKEISMLVKKTDEDHKYLFLAPFTWDAWVSILLTVVAMGPFLWLVHRSSSYYHYYQMQDGKGLFKMANCVWYCFGAIVQQGGDYLPMAISGRILITFWWLFVIVTVTTYSGNLVALLTFPKIFNPINDLADLITYKNVLKYGATRTSGIEELIKDSENEALRMLTDNIVYYDSINSEKLFTEVKQMRMVFLATDTEIRYLISEDFKKYNTCQLMIAKEPILSRSVSFVIGHDKPLKFKQKIDYEVGRMAKSGLVTLWNKMYEVKGNDCLFPLLVRAGDVKKIELSHMVDCFFVLGLGVAVGIVSLAVEMFRPRKPNDAPNSKATTLAKLVELVRPGKLWHKITALYSKVTSGQLYDPWHTKHTEPNGARLPQAAFGAIARPNYPNLGQPLYHNYYGYGRANVSDAAAYLARNQRTQYWNNEQNGGVNKANYNNARRAYWQTTANRF